MAAFPDAGKIQQDFFSEIIFPNRGRNRPEVITGSQYGVDVSVIQLPGGMAMALTSDPLSLIPSLGLRESAWLSVHILANDMATTGFAPQYAQFVLNLPETVTVNEFGEYWKYIHAYCDSIGIAITGGHTGQVFGQNSTIAGGGTMITIAPENAILTSAKAKSGNVIIVTKKCAMTATAILAMSFPETVTNQTGKEMYDAACESFYHTSSLQDALTGSLAAENKKEVTAMHDVTEGGVLGAIYEMASASNVGVFIEEDNIPVSEVQQKICALFSIDPFFVVGAGSMIIAAENDSKETVLKRLHEKNIEATIVGCFTDKPEEKIIFEKEGTQKKLIHPGIDAYWNAFYQAFQKGWK